MIIECFALPEVGKSTVVSDLSKKYSTKSIPQHIVNYKSAFFFIIKQPIFISWLVLTIFKEGLGDKGGSKIVRFKLAVLLSTMSRLEIAHTNYSADDIVIIDEGLIQRLLSLYETKQPSGKYISIIRRMTIADSILFLEYTGESSRIKNGRVGTIRRSVSDEYTERWRSTMLHNYHSLVKALRSEGLIQTSYSRSDDVWFDLNGIMTDIELRKINYSKNDK